MKKKFFSILICALLIFGNLNSVGLNAKAETGSEAAEQQDTEDTFNEMQDIISGSEESESEASESEASESEGSESGDSEADSLESEELPPKEKEISYSDGTISVSGSGFRITVSYTEDAMIPDGAILTAEEISSGSSKYGTYLENAAAKVFEDADTLAKELPYARFFDITILSPEGEKIEPKADVTVDIDLKDDALRTKDVDFAAVHFADDVKGKASEGAAETTDAAVEIVELKKESGSGETVSFNADSFSVYGVVYFYTVDFYYGDAAEYHMNGGSEMMMSELFLRLGILQKTKDIEKIDFTDESLVSFSKEGEDYVIRSLKPFTTSEILTITFKNGDTIRIDVEDATGSGSIGTCTWTLGEDGTLTISGTGTLPNASNVSNPEQTDITTQLRNIYPWQADTYRNDIKKVVIEEGVTADRNLRGAFHNLPNLEEADLSGLDATNLASVHDLFSSSAKLTKVTFSSTFAPRQGWRMFSGCSELTELTFGSVEKPFNPLYNTATPFEQFNTDTSSTNRDNKNAFKGCDKLTTLNMPGAILYYGSVNYISYLTGSFGGANALPKTLNLQNAVIEGSYSAGNPMAPARSMFKFDTLETLNLQEATIYERVLTTLFHNVNDVSGGDTTRIMNYDACKGLKYVDMTGAIFPVTSDPLSNADNCTALSMFQGNGSTASGLGKLETVKLTDADFGTTENFNQMFRNTPSLKKVEINGNAKLTHAVRMRQMFENCAAEEIDISGIGALSKIVNMENCFRNSKVKTLDISNLDNSVIKPLNNNHPARNEADSIGEAAARNNVDWNRYLALDTCKDLEKLIAENSKVWMVYNDRGVPGKEYFNAAADEDVYFFTDKKMEFAADAGQTVAIETDRDYIDLIIDRDGGPNAHTVIPSPGDLPDKDTNINMKSGDLNSNGPGFLAPGIYTLEGKRSEAEHAPMEDTYYRIAYIGDKPFSVDMPSIPELQLVNEGTNNNTTINTKMMSWPAEGTKVIDCGDGIKITYKDVAIDCNGKLHDVRVTIKKITFKDLEKIPHQNDTLNDVPYSERVHDENYPDKVLDAGQEYYRPVLQATKEGIILSNYIRSGTGADPAVPGSGIRMLTGGSGTDIEFTIEIVDANDDTTFVFLAEDLDVAYAQDWYYADNGDACFDVLAVDKVTYGAGGEGFILGDGVKKNTVQFAPKTGLYQSGDMVLSTGGDPNTPWSEFTVTGEAKGATFTWTSGIGCTSYVLRNTKEQNLGEIELQPKIYKELNAGTLSAGEFSFKLEKASTSPSGAPEPSDGTSTPTGVPQTKTNGASGEIVFDKLTFKTKGENTAIYGSDSISYFPGTDPSGNSSGEGKHNTIIYKYKVTEIPGSDPEVLKYDDSEHEIEIRIYTPENDTEMKQGIKAEIYVDGTLADTYWHSVRYNTIETGDLQNKWYDKDGNEIEDPNPISLDDLKFKNIKAKPLDVSIPVEKVLEGRPWKEGDIFAAALTADASDPNAPMPENTKTLAGGGEYAEALIDNTGTPVKDDADKIIGYSTSFDKITYTLGDMTTQGARVSEKTFTYKIKEIAPSLAEIATLPGVTYDTTSELTVKVTVKLDETDPANPELVLSKMEFADKTGAASTSARLVNTYDAADAIYHVTAQKTYFDISNGSMEEGEEIDLAGDEFTFGVKPVGDLAAKAPMPEDTEGEGEDRIYYKKNGTGGAISFEKDVADGLVFNYKDLIDAGIPVEDLHSDEGVDFEYEIFEVIPGTSEATDAGLPDLTADETLVNNDNGTWSVINTNGYETVYDGIHHKRKITVKIRTNDNDTPNDDTDDFDELYVQAHSDDHKDDFYVDKEGAEKPVSGLPGYDSDQHHDPTPEKAGDPVFLNYYFDQPYGSIQIAKIWDDSDDQDEIRPDSVSVSLECDEEDLEFDDLTIGGRTWEGSFDELPVYEFDAAEQALKKITYTVKELSVAGYSVTYDPTETSFQLERENDYMVALTITNKHVPGEGAVEGDETYGGRGQVQTGVPDYNVNPKNPVTPANLVLPEKEGASISDDGKTVTIPGEGEYVLQEDGTIRFTPDPDFVGDPTPVDVEGKDKQGNIVSATYTPHVVDNVQKEDKARIVTYVYENGDPVLDENGDPMVDRFESSFERTGEVDPETGEIIKWSDWSPVDIPEVKSPEVDGYTPDKTSVPAVSSATPDNWPDDEKVVYTKNAPEESFEYKTITRRITFTEYTPQGKEVAKAVVQTVKLKRSIYKDPVTGETTYGEWEFAEGERGAVKSPVKSGWTPNMANVPAWDIDLKDPKDVTVNVIYKPDKVIPVTGDPSDPLGWMLAGGLAFMAAVILVIRKKKYIDK